MSDSIDTSGFTVSRCGSHWEALDGAAGYPSGEEAAAREMSPVSTQQTQLQALAGLAALDIETSVVSPVSTGLHSLFDDVCDKTLPIYFGPLLGKLYLEGL